MSQKFKLFLLCVTLFVLFAISAFAYNRLSDEYGTRLSSSDPAASSPSSASSHDKVSSPISAADFTVYNMQGTPVSLSDFYGKPIVLNFWASWCPPCKSEMPEFNKVYLELGDDVTFLMVDLVDGARETQQNGVQYVTEQGFAFPVYFDLDQQAAITYQVMSIPTTYFIDADGNIVTYALGAIDEDTLRLGIEMAIAGA